MASLRTYYYLAKPGIIRGNMLTGTAGFLLASEGDVRWWRLAAFLAGMSLVIASACVLNNYIDRGLDAKMARTRRRAMVRGLVSARQAFIYAASMGVLGLAVLLMWANLLTAGIGLAALVAYVLVYGYAKRRSPVGTLVGTVPGAAPPVAGYTAVTGHLDGAALLLFLILVFWQMPHFYAIAIYRFKDYKAAGLPVMPVSRGVGATKLRILAYIAGFAAVTPLLWIYGYSGVVYLAAVLALGLAWLGLAVKGFRSGDDQRWARNMFLFSLAVLSLTAAAIGVDSFLG